MKMPDRIDPRMFAPCGMNCMVCYKHCDAKKPCAGCLFQDENKPAHCRACRIRDCARENGLSYCVDCTAYPCKAIRSLERSYRTPYRTSLVNHSRQMREIGLEAFLEHQRAAFTCPVCGGVISLHDAICSMCRAKAPE